MWTVEINCRRFLGNYTIVYTNSFWNQYFSFNQSDLRDRKERIHNIFIGLRGWPTCLLQNTAQPEKRDIFMKNGNEVYLPFEHLYQVYYKVRQVRWVTSLVYVMTWRLVIFEIIPLVIFQNCPKYHEQEHLSVIFENQAHGNIPHFNRWAFYFK